MFSYMYDIRLLYMCVILWAYIRFSMPLISYRILLSIFTYVSTLFTAFKYLSEDSNNDAPTNSYSSPRLQHLSTGDKGQTGEPPSDIINLMLLRAKSNLEVSKVQLQGMFIHVCLYAHVYILYNWYFILYNIYCVYSVCA